MHPIQRALKQLQIDENPFEHLKVSNWKVLDEIDERSACWECGKSRKYFCYVCYVPVTPLLGKIPQIKLPIKIDIIKHRSEIDGKSTAAHAAVLAPDDVKIYTYPDIPDYDETVFLVYPSNNAKTIEHFRQTSDFKITKVVVIDSTWNQSKGIYRDERIKKLPTIILKNRISQFWRHQKGSPRWYLSTIESIHQLVNEFDQTSTNSSNYDDLLFFFCFMYSKIHTLYTHEQLLSYKRPLE